MADARPVPSIAEQLRTARRRRERRRRATIGVLVGVPAVLLGVRLVAETAAEAAGAKTTARPTTSITPTTTAPPTDLDPGLVAAFAKAQAGAADAGHDLTITSGFRTAAEQAAMLQAEIAKRGSLDEARWWVFPPEQSMHVQGLAIDVGDGPAADWLAENGARFGLCKTLAWEWWHFEWRARWQAAHACPAPAQTPDDAPGP